jgi:hypothetical protein
MDKRVLPVLAVFLLLASGVLSNRGLMAGTTLEGTRITRLDL